MRVVPRLLLFAFAVAAVALPASGHGGQTIDVVKASGPVDERLVDFVSDTVADLVGETEVVILQLDSEAAVSGEVERLIDLVESPPVALAVWVGPRPATAYGGAGHVLAAAPLRLAAPGVSIGLLEPVVAGGTQARSDLTVLGLDRSRVSVEEPIAGLVDVVEPALTGVVAALHGRTLVVDGEEVTLETVEEFIDEDLTTRTRAAAPVRFHEPGLVTRTLRTTLAPEVTFLFLVAGVAVAAFEFYAAGVGVAAAVAVLSLALAGYGLATLPIQWWALAMVAVGLALYLVDFQRAAIGVGAVVGTGLLLAGGRYLVRGDQIGVSWWGVTFVVIGLALFFLFAMTTVVRARFSTPTIGRADLIGRRGTAATDVAPDGTVLVDGAHWQATAHRESGIGEGDPVVVVGVMGTVLEVERLSRPG